jgi:crossover junction endodeoxyribonuclease RusA
VSASEDLDDAEAELREAQRTRAAQAQWTRTDGRLISIEVLGEPAPKGSMRAMLVRGRPMMIPGGTSVNQKKLRAWTNAIKQAVAAALGCTGVMYAETALEVNLLFKLVRPKSVTTHRPIAQKDDVDKLARATLDALTGSLYDDDGRIAVLVVEKQWGDPSKQGVVITIRPLDPPMQRALDLSST